MSEVQKLRIQAQIKQAVSQIAKLEHKPSEIDSDIEAHEAAMKANIAALKEQRDGVAKQIEAQKAQIAKFEEQLKQLDEAKG